MLKIKEGLIKFNYKCIDNTPISNSLNEINFYRNKLYGLGLIGSDNGVGYGNISMRVNNNEFIITGSKTGNLNYLNKSHYTKIINFDFEKNFLMYQGVIEPSSESLTHAALYSINGGINTVIHIHNLNLWNKLINKVPTTKDVDCGSVEIAKEIIRLFKESDLKGKKILVMLGHRSGLISFGKNLEEAYSIIINQSLQENKL